MSQSILLTLFMNTAVVTPATGTTQPPAEVAKPSDCDSKDKKVGASLTEPKTEETKSAEEKALANLGLKKDEPKKPGNPVVTSATGMETCK
ncbi:MAG: hypothetical protein EOP04_05310 [Proteobacteria bacterium]|nr:MAG: hypothetical protein EOP04_05310 [Pseudomonadota bacterium]